MKAVKQSSERSCRLWVKRYSFAMSAFSSSFESGHSPTRRPRPFRADSVAKLLTMLRKEFCNTIGQTATWLHIRVTSAFRPIAAERHLGRIRGRRPRSASRCCMEHQMEARSLLAQDVILSSAKCLPGYRYPTNCLRSRHEQFSGLALIRSICRAAVAVVVPAFAGGPDRTPVPGLPRTNSTECGRP
jgi:hypothetical protein